MHFDFYCQLVGLFLFANKKVTKQLKRYCNANVFALTCRGQHFVVHDRKILLQEVNDRKEKFTIF